MEDSKIEKFKFDVEKYANVENFVDILSIYSFTDIFQNLKFMIQSDFDYDVVFILLEKLFKSEDAQKLLRSHLTSNILLDFLLIDNKDIITFTLKQIHLLYTSIIISDSINTIIINNKTLINTFISFLSSDSIKIYEICEDILFVIYVQNSTLKPIICDNIIELINNITDSTLLIRHYHCFMLLVSSDEHYFKVYTNITDRVIDLIKSDDILMSITLVHVLHPLSQSFHGIKYLNDRLIPFTLSDSDNDFLFKEYLTLYSKILQNDEDLKHFTDLQVKLINIFKSELQKLKSYDMNMISYVFNLLTEIFEHSKVLLLEIYKDDNFLPSIIKSIHSNQLDFVTVSFHLLSSYISTNCDLNLVWRSFVSSFTHHWTEIFKDPWEEYRISVYRFLHKICQCGGVEFLVGDKQLLDFLNTPLTEPSKICLEWKFNIIKDIFESGLLRDDNYITIITDLYNRGPYTGIPAVQIIEPDEEMKTATLN